MAEEMAEMGRRLAAAARAVRTSKAVYDDNLAMRNRLIVEALEAGHNWRDVGRWTELSQVRLQQVLVRAQAPAVPLEAV